MSGETPTGNSGWTIETYSAHNEALRESQEKFLEERDRRYSEVKAAEEKALKVKEQADRDALDLARQIQTYKDEKANELREQIASERGLYATKGDLNGAVEKLEAIIKPLLDFRAASEGKRTGNLDTRALIFAIIAATGVVVTVLLALRPQG